MNGDNSSASIYQVLFTSSDNELFMFFEETVEENTEIHVAILNLDNIRFGQSKDYLRLLFIRILFQIYSIFTML